MVELRLGGLVAVPASTRTELLAPPTLEALEALGRLGDLGVVEIDPELSDTATTRDAFGLDGADLANCVLVGGRREGVERLAACVALSTTRVDVNNAVRRRLDVRKASFLATDRAVELSSMQYGGITPIGLPPSWRVLVDARVARRGVVVIGSGVRRSKLLVAGDLIAELSGGTVVEDLAVQL